MKMSYDTKKELIEALKEFIATIERDASVCEALDDRPYLLRLSGTVILGAEPTGWVGAIVAQARRGEEFSQTGHWFTASNDIELASVVFPRFVPGTHTLFVRGSDTTKDPALLHIPIESLPAVAKAISEYNKQRRR